MIKPPKRIIQQDVAAKVGVRQSAVSAILSGSKTVRVSEETRAKVLAVAEELGYVSRKPFETNASASLRSQSVLIVEEERSPIATNEDWLETAYQALMGKIWAASGRYLQEHGIGLSVFHLGDPKKLTQWLAESGASGVLWHANDTDSALLHWVASRFPLVLLNREWRSPVPFDSVSVDQEKNILLAAEYLWSLGHRRIATFGHFPGSSFYRRRMAAYRQFVDERGLRNYVEFQEIPDDLEVPSLDKVEAIIGLWKNLGGEAPTALITSDVFALPLLREARLAGISIPDDLSVVGIDNTAPCSMVQPPLTSLETPFEEMCRVAVDLLLRRRADPTSPSQSVQIAPRMVVRESVRRNAETLIAQHSPTTN